MLYSPLFTKPAQMKQFSNLTIVLLIFIHIAGCKKNTILKGNENTTPTEVPLMDLGTSTYRGFEGGLYSGGSNTRPSAHNSAGVAIAQTIKPLTKTATIDETNGKIVWLSIGMSNTTMDSQAFLTLMQSFTNKNPRLAMIDGAEGGQDINIIKSASASYWDTVNNRLTIAGLTAAQVQVIWLEEAEATPTDTSFATYPDALKVKYKTVMKLLKTKFPNLKLCYLSDRIYAGYATSKLNPEPFAWYTGWTVKRLIADQISGDATLNFNGANPAAAWLSWGPYLWAKGTTPRSDGLKWLPSDYQADGTHPSATGRQKTAQMLLQFFSTDETTKPWFLKP